MTIEKDDTQDKPLDPAVEQVRAKLVRFMIINLGILFIALMAVVIAIVYRSSRAPQSPIVAPSELPQPAGGGAGGGDMAGVNMAGGNMAGGETSYGTIALPTGARISGHTFSGNRLNLDVTLADGSRTFLIYDIPASRVIARIDVTTTP